MFNTAGVSPVDATTQQIFDVDVLGTAHVLDEFLPFVEEGTVGVIIASMAATMTDLEPDVLIAMATTPTEELGHLAVFDPSIDPARLWDRQASEPDAGPGRSISWGQRGGRVASISPGIISTANGSKGASGQLR